MADEEGEVGERDEVESLVVDGVLTLSVEFGRRLVDMGVKRMVEVIIVTMVNTDGPSDKLALASLAERARLGVCVTTVVKVSVFSDVPVTESGIVGDAGCVVVEDVPDEVNGKEVGRTDAARSAFNASRGRANSPEIPRKTLAFMGIPPLVDAV